MFFWKKDASKKILNFIRNVKRDLKNLESTTDKKGKSIEIIKSILTNIENAKSEILERANEEKEKP